MKKLIVVIFIYIALSLSAFDVISIAADETFYKVGMNDSLLIKVLDHDELETITTVSSDGNINFPFIGTVHVKNMSLSEIEKEITKRLGEGYMKFPVVTVSLLKSLSKNVYAYGEVFRRGAIPFEERMTLLMALSTAGGITEDGLYGELKVRRKQKGINIYKDISIDLKGTIAGTVKDISLEPDDIIIVERNKEFFIHGAVNIPGKKALEKNMTVLRALSKAGGLTSEGLHGKVIVKRKQKEKNTYEEIVVDLKGMKEGGVKGDMLLQPDDDLIIERNETFSIQGEVATRGRFALEKDMTVFKALLMAGGVSKDGSYGKVKVRRKHAGSPGGYEDIIESKLDDGVIEDSAVEDTVLQTDDVIVVERIKTILMQGEVTSRGRFTLEKDMTVLKALLQAGGIAKDGLYGRVKVRRKNEKNAGDFKDIIESKLENGVIQDKVLEDMLLEPDDIIVVERNSTFLIYGEVNKVGEYVLQDDMTILKAITIAGGVTKWGAENKVKILRQKPNKSGIDIIKVNIKDVLDGDISKDIKLEEGDTVVVTAGIF
ncbi:hypothetical protein C4544_02120 [candidate division WS5 bacterium]|uniref:Polysaccharide export protein n=1 Tax=candidate division WS5 bacterium TaxID=2093353 RepID=A0A419DEY5_9BACT|nr:MAG: hypothetical protein C4544_02120 [candidate division WS5 bacterium]